MPTLHRPTSSLSNHIAPNMAANTTRNEDYIVSVPRSQTPGPIIYQSPQPRRPFRSIHRISRRRASSTSAIPFTDLNRRAIYDEAVRRAHQTPPLEELPALEESLPNPNIHFPEFPVEVSAPSLSSSTCSTPSAAAFGLYSSSEPLSLPSSVAATTFTSPALGIDFG
jgi:hypothetical protein